MPSETPDNLETLQPSELLELVRELLMVNEQLRSQQTTPPTAAQSLLDDQLRRTSLLTQLAIEFRESVDPAAIVEHTLRAVTVHLVVAGASIVLVGPNSSIELATVVVDGTVQPMDHSLAVDVVEKGLAGWALRHGSSVALSDVARDRRWLEFSERHRSGSVIVIPVRQSSATLGVLTVHRSVPYAFSSHDLILLEGVAAQLGVALSAARHQASERQRRNQAMALLAMSQFLTAERTPTELATMLQEKSIAVFGAQAGLLFLADDGDELHPVLPQGDQAPDENLVSMASGAARLAWASQRIATTGPAPDVTCVSMPLINHGVAIGAYALVHSSGGNFSAAVWSLLTVFTHAIAAACANINLVTRLVHQARSLESLVDQRTQQVIRSRDALRAIFDHLSEGILLLDSDERVVAANAYFCKQIVGLHPREVVGQSYAQVRQLIERQGAVTVENLPMASGGRQRFVVRQIRSNGQRNMLVERTPVGSSARNEQMIEFWRNQPA
ncbi:MAG: GAF domain-containing protein [Candidatus Viridilinea halotolerans]|uniref:GAF domain-containing protein n=1 Tax=Candidatus Viridilinea halotolerans TaxID=2491704 RepID=A0A426TW47_9CHLR|nr:MAG: GAF domain-containing protein [Candidatus Viridilinea halotolerans]